MQFQANENIELSCCSVNCMKMKRQAALLSETSVFSGFTYSVAGFV
jgi:hypothetical protein